MNKHTATHDGLTFTRNSAGRAYTHAVIVPVSLAERIELAEDCARRDWKNNHAWHTHVATGRPYNHGNGYTSTFDADQVASSQAWLDAGLEGLLAELREIATRRWKEIHGDRATSWSCLGWCGRPDLAAKLASKEAGAVILEATVVVTGKAKAVRA